MKKSRKMIAMLVTTLLALALLAGCGGDTATTDGGSASGGDAPATSANAGGSDGVIKIGIVNPETGPLGGFGEGEKWIDDLFLDYVNNELGGIEIGGTKMPIEIIVYDSQSDTTKCTEMTQKLITDDKVDLILARHTPETVNPVSAVAERYGIPCIAMEAPVDAWLAEGPYEWVYHTHWTLDQMYEQYKGLWTTAGFPPNSGAKIGLLFANDADGTAWHGVFADKIVADGYELVDPGQFPADTNNFTDIIKQFKDAGVNILCGTNVNPVFREFWTASKASGFAPDFVTMGKAYLLQADADAIGPELMDGLTGEVWWSPVHPYTSGLTGATPKDLADQYLADTGRPITQPMGFKYASLEAAIDALSRTASLEPDDLIAAIGAMDVDTVVGHVKYNDDHYSTISLTGGQWVNEDGQLNLYIVDNSLDSAIPTTGDLKPLAK